MAGPWVRRVKWHVQKEIIWTVFDYERFDLRDPAEIARFLQTAASLAHRHGGSLLSGDAEAFREFQSKADERERSYVEMMDRQHSAQH